MELLVDDVLSPDKNKKRRGLEGLLQETRRNRGRIVISNIPRFFIAIHESLSDSESEITSNALQVLQEIIPVPFT
jgi:hypothetical protein